MMTKVLPRGKGVLRAAVVEKLVILWGAVLANLKASGLRLTARKSRLGAKWLVS